MKEKINIAKLLKDCPSGMELDCPMYDNVQLNVVIEKHIYPIKIQTPDGVISLTKDGCYSRNPHCKCIIFPKGKTTWEGFVPPCKFKDGDVVVCVDCYEPGEEEIAQIYILKYQTSENHGFCYAGYDFKMNKFHVAGSRYFQRHATEEERQKLFDAIKANGYKWNPETKTLEKLIVPKFKVGDRVKHKDGYFSGEVTKINGEYFIIKYDSDAEGSLDIRYQDNYESVPNKFDITTLKPFDSKVLVRSSMDGLWKPAVFGFRNGYNDNAFYIVGGSCWKQCIPYLNNEHLCGTTNDCDEYYKTWE